MTEWSCHYVVHDRSHLFGLVRLGRGGVHARSDT